MRVYAKLLMDSLPLDQTDQSPRLSEPQLRLLHTAYKHSVNNIKRILY